MGTCVECEIACDFIPLCTVSPKYPSDGRGVFYTNQK